MKGGVYEIITLVSVCMVCARSSGKNDNISGWKYATEHAIRPSV
jgi:hypothetical protein